MKKNTVIKISMDENDEIELVMDGAPLNLATALVCGLSRAAVEIYGKLPEPAQKVFLNELAEISFNLDPANKSEEDEK